MRGGDGTSTQPQGTARVQSRKAPTYVPVRDKLRSQPGRKDHQAYRNSKGKSNLKRGRQGQRFSVSIAGCYRSCCIDSRSGMLTESWKCEEGTVCQPSLKHSKRPRQEGSNLQPGEGEGKEPTRTKDHQAHRNCKGS